MTTKLKTHIYSFIKRALLSSVFAGFIYVIGLMFTDFLPFEGYVVPAFIGVTVIDCMMQPDGGNPALKKAMISAAEKLSSTFAASSTSFEALFISYPNVIVFCKENMEELRKASLGNANFTTFLDRICEASIEVTSDSLNPFTDSTVNSMTTAMASFSTLLAIGDANLITKLCPNATLYMEENLETIIALVCSEKDVSIKNQNVRFLSELLGLPVLQINDIFLKVSMNTAPLLIDLQEKNVGSELLDLILKDMEVAGVIATDLHPETDELSVNKERGLPGGKIPDQTHNGKRYYSPKAYWDATHPEEAAAGGGGSPDNSSIWKRVAIFTLCAVAGGAAAYVFGPSFFSATKETLKDIIKNFPSTVDKR